VESKWKNYYNTTFPGQSLSKTGLNLEEAIDLSRDRKIEKEDSEHGINPLNRSGASETHIHTSGKKTIVLYSRELRTCESIRILRSIVLT
jgi:hypothetical protein